MIRTLQQLRQPDGLLLASQELTCKHKWVQKERKLLAKLLEGARGELFPWENGNSETWRAKAVANVLDSDSETFQQQDESSSCEKDSAFAFQSE